MGRFYPKVLRQISLVCRNHQHAFYLTRNKQGLLELPVHTLDN